MENSYFMTAAYPKPLKWLGSEHINSGPGSYDWSHGVLLNSAMQLQEFLLHSHSSTLDKPDAQTSVVSRYLFLLNYFINFVNKKTSQTL